MARQPKQGLDYFPLDVHTDDKIELLEAEHGLTGFAIYVKLLQKIYSEGYFYKIGEDELLLTARRLNVDINPLNDVINSCIKRSLFNNVVYEKYNVLTSRGIQKRYLEATVRRKEITLISEYWLDVEYDSKITTFINVDINPLNDVISTQSKVKKSKEEKSKEKKKKDNGVSFEKIWTIYEKKGNRKTSLAKWSKLPTETQDLIFKKVPAYVESTPDKQYRKNFETYLNQESWNDEIIKKQSGLFGNNESEDYQKELDDACNRKLGGK